MKKILIVAGLLVAAGIAYGLYEFNRTGKDTSKKASDFVLQAAALSAAFEMDEVKANDEYLDKVIEVEGVLLSQEVGNPTILTIKGTDMVNLRAELTTNDQVEAKAGDLVRLKGICTGLLLDVVLTECVILD